MTNTPKDTVRFKEIDGEIYLHAQDLQKSFKAFFRGVVTDLEAARAYADARKMEIISDAVTGRIASFRTDALARVVKATGVNRKFSELVNNIFFGGSNE